MKFLMNMNIPRELCRLLEGKGYGCRHAGDIGLAKADDPEIVKEAKISKEVIITEVGGRNALEMLTFKWTWKETVGRFASVALFSMGNLVEK